jgi:hypothetical protein
LGVRDDAVLRSTLVLDNSPQNLTLLAVSFDGIKVILGLAAFVRCKGTSYGEGELEDGKQGIWETFVFTQIKVGKRENIKREQINP